MECSTHSRKRQERRSCGASRQYEGFKKLEVLVDSGAAASVMPQRYVDDRVITKGEAAKKGVHYVAADGGRIPNLGEVRVNLLTKEKEKASVTFQVADVHKPILSVSALTAHGHRVSFTKEGGVITLARTGRRIAFQRKDGVYKLETLMAPGKRRAPETVALVTNSGQEAGATGFTRQAAS